MSTDCLPDEKEEIMMLVAQGQISLLCGNPKMVAIAEATEVEYNNS